jgi:hypothetical protein
MYSATSSFLSPLNTIADVNPASGIRDPELGLESEAEDFRLAASPYMLTDLRSDGRRGSRDRTADGSIEYSIDSFCREAKSAERCRIREMVGFRGRGCAMFYGIGFEPRRCKF